MEMLPISAQALDETHPCFGCPVRSSAICAVLNSEDLGHFKRSGATVARAAGEAIFFEGDIATHVYNLTSGVMRLSKLLPDGRRQIAGFLFPGDFLGITMEDEHAFTAEAITPLKLCQFSRARFDAILLDVDNGPEAFTQRGNASLYSPGGLDAAWQALKPDGAFAVWSTGPAVAFEAKLRRAGFNSEVHRVSARGINKGPMHAVYIGRKRA